MTTKDTLILNEVSPASRAFLAGLGPGGFKRFSTGAEVLARVARRGGPVPPEVREEAYAPFVLRGDWRGAPDPLRLTGRLDELVVAFLRGEGFRAQSGAATVEQESFELAPALEGGAPVFVSKDEMARLRARLAAALREDPAQRFLGDGLAVVTADPLVFASAARQQGGATAAGAATYETASLRSGGLALGPGAGPLGLTWLIPDEPPPLVPQVDCSVAPVPGSRGYRGDPFAVGAADFDEAQNLGVSATEADLAKLEYPPSRDPADVGRARVMRNQGWLTVGTRAEVDFAAAFFALRPEDQLPLSVETFGSDLRLTSARWALRLRSSPVLAATPPFLRTAAAAAARGDLPVCALAGPWLNMALAPALGCFVLPRSPLDGPPVLRPPTWNDGLVLRRRGDAGPEELGAGPQGFDARLRRCLLLPLLASYYALFPERLSMPARPRVGADLRLLAPLGSLAEAEKLAEAVERFLSRPGLRLRLASPPTRGAALELRWRAQQALPAGFRGGSAIIRAAGGPEAGPGGGFEVAFAELEPPGRSSPVSPRERPLRAALLDHLQVCYNDAGLSLQPFAEMAAEELAEVLVLGGRPTFCAEASLLAEGGGGPTLNPYTRRPLGWQERARARMAAEGAAGFFDVGPLAGFVPSPVLPLAPAPGRVVQEASLGGVLVGVDAGGRWEEAPAAEGFFPAPLELLEVRPRGAEASPETMALLQRAWGAGLFLSWWGLCRAPESGTASGPESAFGSESPARQSWVAPGLRFRDEGELSASLAEALRLASLL